MTGDEIGGRVGEAGPTHGRAEVRHATRQVVLPENYGGLAPTCPIFDTHGPCLLGGINGEIRILRDMPGRWQHLGDAAALDGGRVGGAEGPNERGEREREGSGSDRGHLALLRGALRHGRERCRDRYLYVIGDAGVMKAGTAA